MSKKIAILLFSLFSLLVNAQTIRLSGNVNDTAVKGGLPNVLLMALKFSDSSLVNYTRTNNAGVFNPVKVPLDTYIVILSHPGFSDKTYFLVPSPGDSTFNFKNVLMPPKSVELTEVEIIAPKEKTYYKGDTLIFTADSFKTAPNATVEDLLKKLPGIRVSVDGKITVQGKEVDQVLVDGDEFFGSDPTIATRNLNATSIENVQVFDKKNESTEEGANETLKILNLKLKDDAKKGYFGKVSGASDFQNFYEGELLANRFKGNRKISVFSLAANTPKQAFGGGDVDKYGLNGEQSWTYNEETGNWENNNNRGTGLPLTFKSGFYFNDKFGKNTKINSDYTFNQNRLLSYSETNTQFFLTDTTYTNRKIKSNESKNQNHALNFRVMQKLDSLTELTIAPKLRYNNSENSNTQTDDFISEDRETTRRTVIKNTTNSETNDVNIFFRVNRNFMKKDRNINITYQPIYYTSSSKTSLNTDFIYYNGQQADSSLAQKRTQENSKMEHNGSIVYTEPFTKKIKGEVSYNFTNNENTNNRETYNHRASGYDLLDSNLSNNFENRRVIHRAGTKLIYEVKKYRIVIGSYFRNIEQENTNLTTGRKLDMSINNILPLASFNYRINQGSNLFVNYVSSSQQPDLQQMQPVQDNTDPNRISIGNPDLQPTFSNNVTLNYYFYKGIKDVNFWSGGNFINTNNQISFATNFDAQGRAITQPVNINGNYNTNVWFGGGFPLFKKFMKVYYNFNGGFANNVSIINGLRNLSQNISLTPGLTLEKNAEKFTVGIGGDYSYNIPKTTISIQSNQPYYSYGIEGNVHIKLSKKLVLSTDGRYNNNGNRTPGYNINFFIWNASLSHAFLKTENLILSINANDILNQNISNQRYLSSNQIVDTKTQIIRRYFLLKLLYKFNNQKTKVEDNDY